MLFRLMVHTICSMYQIVCVAASSTFMSCEAKVSKPEVCLLEQSNAEDQILSLMLSLRVALSQVTVRLT